MASNNGLLSQGYYDPMADRYYQEGERRRMMNQQMAAMQNAAMGLGGYSNEKQAAKQTQQATKPADPQPNPVLLLTGEDE